MTKRSVYLREGTAVLLVKIEPTGVVPLGNAYACNNAEYLAAPASLFATSDRLAFVMLWDDSSPAKPTLDECIPVTIVRYDRANDSALLKITQQGASSEPSQG